MRKNNMNIIYGILGVLVVGGLFAWPVINDETRPMVKAWNAAGIACLPSHQNAAQHIHPYIAIAVDGVSENIPESTGRVKSCMAEMHLHDKEPGMIHLESVDPLKKFKLSDFMFLYGKSLEREGYKLEVMANSNLVADPANLIFEDKQQILLNYTKLEQAAAE